MVYPIPKWDLQMPGKAMGTDPLSFVGRYPFLSLCKRKEYPVTKAVIIIIAINMMTLTYYYGKK